MFSDPGYSVTDANGELYEHVEYFPFGETWVQEHSNTQRTPYLYTGKELDEETQLYYYGARYYDPRTSVWQSADPILGGYLAGKSNGGVYNPLNLGLYEYSFNNPIRYLDPDGNLVITPQALSAIKKALTAPAPTAGMRKHGMALAMNHAVLAASALDNHEISADRYELEIARAEGYYSGSASLPETNGDLLLTSLDAIAFTATLRGAVGLTGAVKGAVTNGRFAQVAAKGNKEFSEFGKSQYSRLAGAPIRTVNDLTDALRAGKIKPKDIPVDYVEIGGNRIVLNTRTSTALENAGISQSEWFGRNMTGKQVPGAPAGWKFEDAAMKQIQNNPKVGPNGSEALIR